MSWTTIVDFFTEIGALRGTFVVYDDGYRPRRFTYREMAEMAQAFALRLQAAGIRKGEKILIWSENRPGWIGALWGCVLEGVILVPLDYRVSADFLTRVSTLTEARTLLIGEEVSAPAEISTPIWRLSEIEEQSAKTPARGPAIQPDDIVQIVFTSGATAEPKGVVITHRNLLANMVPVDREVRKYKKYGRPFFPIRFLNLLPLSHLFGQSMAAYIPPMLAGVVVFMKSVEPRDILHQVRERRVSVLVCVPKMLEVLRAHVASRFPEASNPAAQGRWWIRWWRYRRIHRAFGFKFWAFIVGAAPLPQALEEFWSNLGFLVVQGYGLTETAPIVTLNHPFHARKGTVGKPIAGIQVKIDPDGEILVRGANVTTGYYGDPQKNSELFEDGWLHTGDLGEITPDGNLIVKGRKKDLIVSPEGLNIHPEDIERVLEQIQGVKEAAVVGPDRVHAVVVLEPGADKDEIVKRANERLEEHQRVRTVHVWPERALPRTAGTGKLKRSQIRESLNGKPTPQPVSETGGVLGLLRSFAPGRTITTETTLDELGLSSLERVELMSGIEEQLGGARDPAAFASAKRVWDLMNLPAAPEGLTDEYPRWSRSLPARIFRRVLLPMLVFPLTRYYARLKIIGIEHLAGLNTPLIFASNHQSHMDVPAILAALPSRLRYRIATAMSKDFFAAHFHPSGRPLRERFVRSLQYYLAVLCFNAFPMPQRESGAGEALRYAGELAGDGWSILIFPEGIRTEGEILPFHPGVAVMASRLSVPILPIRIRGLEKVLHKDARWATPGRVQISFGAPLKLMPGDWRELTNQVQDAVERL